MTIKSSWFVGGSQVQTPAWPHAFIEIILSLPLIQDEYCKTCVKRPLSKRLIIGFQGITVRLGTVSVGAIEFTSIRNKYGCTLINPNFCSADTWS